MRKVIEAKSKGESKIVVWGSGTPRRELLYSEDLGEACVFLLNLPEVQYEKLFSEDQPPLINIGTGKDLTIREIAELVCRVLDFDGSLEFDPTRPDGTPRKLMDVSYIESLGWHATTALEEGIRLTYAAAKSELVAK